MEHPYDIHQLLRDEVIQARESGIDLTSIEAELGDITGLSIAEAYALFDRFAGLPRRADWAYDEPESLAEILATLPEAAPTVVDAGRLVSQVNGGWLGRIAGCNVGKPVEDGDRWNRARIKEYLEIAGAYPLRDYVPKLDPMPEGFELKHCWPTTTLGNVDGSARDDDIDYPILALHLVEKHGDELAREHVGLAWLGLFPFLRVFTAERAVYANLVSGIPAAQAATTRNPYREWIGALIRGDVYGWINPGNPRAAAEWAYRDASLSHTANGVYGEMWSAALVAAAFTATDAEAAIVESLRHVPPRSRLAEAVESVLAGFRAGLEWEAMLDAIEADYGHYNWVHTVNNAAVIAAGLLWGRGDYMTAIGLTVQGGLDTDSNAATVGSVMGVLLGVEALPAHLVDPLHDTTRSALFGFDNSRISGLAERTLALVRTPVV